jgi:hypothetical protein
VNDVTLNLNDVTEKAGTPFSFTDYPVIKLKQDEKHMRINFTIHDLLLRIGKTWSRLFDHKWLTLLLLVVLAAGCKKTTEEAGLKGICPEVVSTDPANGAINVVTQKIITATFNEVMDASTINEINFIVRQGTNSVSGTVTYSGLVATFTPSSPLLANTVYTATMKKEVKDPAKNSMIADYVWSFNTGAVPIVVSTDPANGATDVALNKVVTATFSTNMNPATINATTFTMKQGATVITGVVTYSGMTASFTPTVPFLENKVYTGTITTGAKDVAGNALAANYTWSFATGSKPVVISTDPVNGAVNVPVNKVVTATFSKVMNPLTLNNTTFLLQQGSTSITGVVTYSGNTASFTPAAPLSGNTVYTATITTGAQDVAGNGIASNYVWSFTTADVTLPVVISTDPANNATGVLLNKQITATFNKAMNPSTINGSTFLLKDGTTPVFGTVTYSGTTATFSPALNLNSGTLYTATITTGAKDVSGNAMAANYTWSFTTASPVIPPPPMNSINMFGAFGGSAGITNQGLNTVINNGSIGTTGASTLITGFHDGTTGDIYTETPLNKGLVTGRIYTAPPAPGTAASFAIAQQGYLDAVILYNSISPASKPGGTDPGAGELGGLTLPPGIYKSASGTFNIANGNLTLDAMGDANATWIFQTAAGLTVGVAGPLGNRSVLLINGAQAKNVYWYVGSAATINGAGGGVMTGTIVSSAGMTFSTAGNAVQTVLNGRAISLNASVTMVNTTINVPN